MSDHRCGHCIHYKPTRNPDTGRVLTSQAGQCTYPVVWPVLPISYEGLWGRPWSAPRSACIWSGTRANICPFYEEPVKKRTSTQKKLL